MEKATDQTLFILTDEDEKSQEVFQKLGCEYAFLEKPCWNEEFKPTWKLFKREFGNSFGFYRELDDEEYAYCLEKTISSQTQSRILVCSCTGCSFYSLNKDTFPSERNVENQHCLKCQCDDCVCSARKESGFEISSAFLPPTGFCVSSCGNQCPICFIIRNRVAKVHASSQD